MFKNYVLQRIRKCCTLEDFLEIRRLLREYGIQNFYNEMEQLGIFENGSISGFKNPFVQMLEGKKLDEFTDLGKYILIDGGEHYLLTPKILEWESFNILTLNSSHLEMLREMKRKGESITKDLYFHCYPFNSVQTLHLHLVIGEVEKEFLSKKNNLHIDCVIQCLENNN